MLNDDGSDPNELACCGNHHDEDPITMGPVYAAQLGFETVEEFVEQLETGLLPARPDVLHLAALLGADPDGCV